MYVRTFTSGHLANERVSNLCRRSEIKSKNKFRNEIFLFQVEHNFSNGINFDVFARLLSRFIVVVFSRTAILLKRSAILITIDVFSFLFLHLNHQQTTIDRRTVTRTKCSMGTPLKADANRSADDSGSQPRFCKYYHRRLSKSCRTRKRKLYIEEGNVPRNVRYSI